MGNPALVRMRHPECDGTEERPSVLRHERQTRIADGNGFLQSSPFAPLEDDPRLRRLLEEARVEHRNDIGVREAREEASLVDERRDLLCATGGVEALGPEELHRDGRVEDRVASFIDVAEPARADEASYAVSPREQRIRERRADHAHQPSSDSRS